MNQQGHRLITLLSARNALICSKSAREVVFWRTLRGFGVFTWVIYPGLDYIIQCKPAGCLFGAQFIIQRRCEDLGHIVVVLGEVGIFLLRRELHLQLVVTVSERHGCCSLSVVVGK